MEQTRDGAILPGTSYENLLHSEPASDQRRRFCEYGNSRMILEEGYKLIVRTPGPHAHFPDEFYDLNVDPRERENVIDDPQYSFRVKELRNLFANWFKEHSLPERTGTDVAQLANMHDTSPWNLDPDNFPVIFQ